MVSNSSAIEVFPLTQMISKLSAPVLKGLFGGLRFFAFESEWTRTRLFCSFSWYRRHRMERQSLLTLRQSGSQESAPRSISAGIKEPGLNDKDVCQ